MQLWGAGWLHHAKQYGTPTKLPTMPHADAISQSRPMTCEGQHLGWYCLLHRGNIAFGDDFHAFSKDSNGVRLSRKDPCIPPCLAWVALVAFVIDPQARKAHLQVRLYGPRWITPRGRAAFSETGFVRRKDHFRFILSRYRGGSTSLIRNEEFQPSTGRPLPLS